MIDTPSPPAPQAYRREAPTGTGVRVGFTPAARATVTVATVVDTQRRVTAALLCELEPHLAAGLTRNQVAATVRQAVADLCGSVCVEALPEMAARLAHHRLQATIQADLDGMTPATRRPSTATRRRQPAPPC